MKDPIVMFLSFFMLLSLLAFLLAIVVHIRRQMIDDRKRLPFESKRPLNLYKPPSSIDLRDGTRRHR